MAIKQEIRRNPGQRTGVAPKIRILKDKFPEMSEAKIAKRVGCSPSNVHRVLSTYLSDLSEDELRNYQENKGDTFDSVVARSILSITPEKLANSSAVQLATVAGIAFDKSQLAHGLATGINVTVLMDVVEAIRERRVVEQQALQASILNRVQSGDSEGKIKVV